MKLVEAIRRPRVMMALAVLAVGLAVFGLWQLSTDSPVITPEFDGERAYSYIVAQMSLGPRITGTEPSLAAGQYVADQLEGLGWQVEFQPFVYMGTRARNIVARANVGRGPILMVGAHYDTRRRADRDSDQPTEPVPGANDGASGVAVLLELARVLDLPRIPYEIWLAFFDAEDNGGLDGWDWIAGSTYMAENLTPESLPESMILVDMIGDADQGIYFDSNSDPELSAKVWETAARLGYAEYFIPAPRWAMIDDHIPFARRGIPAIVIIDFDYAHWHTTADTSDKVSAASLEHVGRTLEAFLEQSVERSGE